MSTDASLIVVVGTDTNVGKTYISCALLRWWQRQGLCAQGVKPIASGCTLTPDGWRNDDALLLQQASSEIWPYDCVNPFAFVEPVSPHLAASPTSILQLDAYFDELEQWRASFAPHYLCIEGAGGWLVPINQQQSLADWIVSHHWPVVLVVGLRLGCLNHALLTQQAIQLAGVPFVGWIANQCQPEAMPRQQENIAFLRQRLSAPYWGMMGYGQQMLVNGDGVPLVW
jgi:dethiobiotin synthetase